MVDADDDGPFDLDDLLWVLVQMPSSTCSLYELLKDCQAREIEVDARGLAELVLEGQDQDLLCVWEEAGPVGHVTLTPLAAERLNVQLDIESGQWCSRQVEWTERSGGPDEVHWQPLDPAVHVDPTLPEPLDVLIQEEEYGALIGPGTRKLRDGSRVSPKLILGIGLQWPEAFEAALVRIEGDGFVLLREVCRGCGSDGVSWPRWKRGVYCTICDRSGVDGLFPAIEPELQSGRSRYAVPATDLKGGTGEPPPQRADGRPRRHHRRARGAA
jgi:hypothetical protein